MLKCPAQHFDLQDKLYILLLITYTGYNLALLCDYLLENMKL